MSCNGSCLTCLVFSAITMLHKLQHHNKILELAELFQCDCSAQTHMSSILIFCYLHYFNYYVLWPTTVTAKPKTSRQTHNTSRQNQKPHSKNKIPHGKTKSLTAKPKTSQQNQILHSKNQIPYGISKYPPQNQS